MENQRIVKPQPTPTPWSVETDQVPFLPKNQGGGMKVRIMGARQKAPIYQGMDSKAFSETLTQTARRERVASLNVGLTPEIARANAAFIVRAVNAHEELVHFVKEVKRVADEGLLTPEWSNMAKALIAKAEEK